MYPVEKSKEIDRYTTRPETVTAKREAVFYARRKGAEAMIEKMKRVIGILYGRR